MKLKQKGKILAAAMAMMTLSTAAAVTGTVAWFTASNIVTASGMSIQADTEQGILIANENFDSWKDSAIASHNGEVDNPELQTNPSATPAKVQARFIPTSTFDATEWYHANSSDFANAEAGQASANYAGFTYGDANELGLNGSATGVYQIKVGSLAITNKNLFLLNQFYIKSSTVEALTANQLYVNEVNAAIVGGGSANSADLNKTLRVLVTCNTNSKLYKAWFAPFEATGEVAKHTIGGTSNKYTPVAQGVKNTVLVNESLTIPGSGTANNSTLCINVWVYFEGEDTNCKSANIAATLDKLALDLKFGTQQVVVNP